MQLVSNVTKDKFEEMRKVNGRIIVSFDITSLMVSQIFHQID